MDIDEVSNVNNNLSEKVNPSNVNLPKPGEEIQRKIPENTTPENELESNQDVLDPEAKGEEGGSSVRKNSIKNEEERPEGEREDVLDPEAEKEKDKKEKNDRKKQDKKDNSKNNEDTSSEPVENNAQGNDGSDFGNGNTEASNMRDVSTNSRASGGDLAPSGNASNGNMLEGSSPGSAPSSMSSGGTTPNGMGTGGMTPPASVTPTPTAPVTPAAGGTAMGGATAGGTAAGGAATGSAVAGSTAAGGAAVGGAAAGGAAAGGAAAGSAAGGAASGVLGNPYVLLAIVIIIVIIGLLGFLFNMPGLMVGKLKAFAQALWDHVQSAFTTTADAFINDEDVVKLAQYLVDMDYDVVGYGFVRAEEVSDDKTYLELEDEGYYMNAEGIYVKLDASNQEVIYSGNYYNSTGKLINNATGTYYVEDEYTKDKYGIKYWATNGEEAGTSHTKGQIASLEDADSNLLRTYLMADYRITVLRNDDEGFIEKCSEALAKTFGGATNAWSKGLIKIYLREGEDVKAPSEFLWWNDISIKDNGTKLSIRKEWLNQPMEFELDGWTGRYGLSLEFLLSLHLGTMAPDLVTAMVQCFDTEVQVYLQSVDDSEIETKYVEKNNSPDVTIDQIEEILGENIFEGTLTEILNNLSISKADCLEVLHADIGIESQNNCTHFYQSELVEMSTEDTEDILWGLIDTSSNPLADYEFEDTYVTDYLNEVQSDYANYVFYNDSGESTKFDLAHCVKDVKSDTSYAEVSSDYTKTYFSTSQLSKLGYDPNNLEVEKYDVIIDGKQTKGRKVTTGVNEWGENTYKIYLIETTKEWTAPYTDTTDTYHESQWFELKSYKIVLEVIKQDVYKKNIAGDYVWLRENNSTTHPDVYPYLDHIYLWEFIVRDKTLEELTRDDVLDENGELDPERAMCSTDKSTTKCCTNCKNYVVNVIRAMAEVNDEDYAYYQPYIARVVGSWFRDTYFMIPEEEDKAIADYKSEHSDWDSSGAYGSESSKNYVKVDEDYLYSTGEYWTDYEMKEDPVTGEETDEYQLYYLNPNGTTSNTKLEDWLEQEHDGVKYANQEDAEKAGFVFVKRTKLQKLSEIKDNVSSEEGGGRDVDKSPYMAGTTWSAYTLGDGGKSGWIEVVPKDSNKFVKKVKEINPDGKFYYQLLSTTSVEQEEDAIRTETNVTVKNLFRYRQFYIYDGTIGKAEAIQQDRDKVLKMVLAYWGSSNGDGSDCGNLDGSNYTKEDAVDDLGVNGRYALREAYGNTTITGLTDDNDIAEAWLEWQLDMYYRAGNEEALSDTEKKMFKLDELCDFGISNSYTDDKGDTVKYLDEDYYTSDNHSLDPRDRNLISTVTITKSSLDAFSILENVNTLDADYQYRDFKELIVELNYFDKEDLSEAIEEVFTWIVPTYTSMWPVLATDKQNSDYGTLVHSQDTVDFLIEVYEKLVQEEKALSGETGEVEEEESDEEDGAGTENEQILSQLKEVESYIENDTVVSPATGKIIAYGERERVNIYTQEKETVGYVKIQVMNYGTDKNDSSQSYFTIGMLPDTMTDEEKEEAVTGLNSFYDEYKDECAGYILMIDGIDITDLKNGFVGITDEDGNAVEYDSLCSYEAEESIALYNTKEQERREKETEAKVNAPYFISYNANYTKVGNEYLASDELGGYYIKEGAYLGKTQSATTRTGVKYTPNSGAQTENPNLSEDSVLVDENPEKTVDMNQVYEEFLDEDKNPTYLRLILLDTELTTIDNVEDYFPGFLYSSGVGLYRDLEAIDESSSREDRIIAAMSYFVEQGFSNEGAAGIVGNMIVESGMDPKADNGHGYYGLCQWNTVYNWWQDVCAWTASQGYNQYDFAGQVRATYECPNTGGMTEERWEELQTMTNTRRAAELFCVYYEACVGGSDAPEWYNKGNLYQALNIRKDKAEEALAIYLGEDTE